MSVIAPRSAPSVFISYRLSLLDLVGGGSAGDEVVALAKAVEAAGATIINTGIGWHEARITTIATIVPRAACAFGLDRGHTLETMFRFFQPVVDRPHQGAIAQRRETEIERGEQVWIRRLYRGRIHELLSGISD